MPSLPAITVVRGTDFTIPLEFKTAEGQALDLTGCTVYLTAKRKWDNDDTDGAAAFKKDTSIHTDPLAGKTEIAGVPGDTLNSKPDRYEYDIELRDTAGRVTSFGKGVFTLQGEMTRRV